MNATEEIRGFVKQVAVVLAVGSVVGGYPIYAGYGGPVALAALIGCGISTANVIIGVVSIVWAFDKPQSVFLKTILGGMAARMATIFVCLFFLAKLTDLDLIPLVVSMFGFYIVFQVLELRFVTQRGQQDATGV